MTFRPLHLSDAVQDLFALHVRQHVELDFGDRIRPAVAVSAIEVDVDAVGDSTESTLGFLNAGVRQPSDPFRSRHGVQCPAVGASAGWRTGKPAASIAVLTSAIRSVPKWNTVAASTASAPAATAGGKSAAWPAPPEAISGTSTTARTALIISRSKPSVVPSASIELSRISPTPCSTPRRAHSTASRPAAFRPPWVVTSKPDGAQSARRASTESTSTWLPNLRVISPITSGWRMAPVLIATLSAPARSKMSTSSTELTPPPTVRRDEHGLGRPAHHLERGLPALDRGRDVEKGQLVGPLGVVVRAELHRIAGVAQVDEVDALDHPAAVHVQARDDTDSDRHDEHSRGPHHALGQAESRQRLTTCTSRRPASACCQQFLRGPSGARACLAVGPITLTIMPQLDDEFLALPLKALSDAALSRAKDLGCSYAEVRVERIRAAYRSFRDHALETTADSELLGVSVRVVHNGVWGFASDITLSTDAAARLAERAIATAKVSRPLTPASVELADEDVHADAAWVSAYEVDPFEVDEATKTGRMLELNEALLARAGRQPRQRHARLRPREQVLRQPRGHQHHSTAGPDPGSSDRGQRW